MIFFVTRLPANDFQSLPKPAVTSSSIILSQPVRYRGTYRPRHFSLGCGYELFRLPVTGYRFINKISYFTILVSFQLLHQND